jgi:hypothetical protein
MISTKCDIIRENLNAGRGIIMKKTDEDLRKDIDDLEKLIEEVKSDNRKDLEQLKKESKGNAVRGVRIDLGADYSPSPLMSLFIGFLVDFILFFLLLDLVGLAEADSILVYVGLAGAFAVYETVIRRYLLRRQLKLVLHSSGLIFFLLHLIFFYAADLLVLPKAFSFYNYWYPAVFVAAFTVLRFFVKTAYVVAVGAIGNKIHRK